jgi:hypothetical protein
MKKYTLIMGNRERSRQLVPVSFSIFLGLVSLPATAVAGIGGLEVPSPNASQLHGGQVTPPSAKPLGFSLSDMAAKTAPFTTSMNDLKLLPKTPFQILYVDFSTSSSVIVGGGLLTTGINSFSVPANTYFYVPILNADDSPPVLGKFPTSPSGAVSYFFNPDQLGADQSIFIKVDGLTTSVGMSYLVGPINTPPLGDGGGTHTITVGVFLTPLSPGKHTVSISGKLSGELIQDLGVTFIAEEFTYTVTVQ